MKYVDGVIIPVPKRKLKAYIKMSRMMQKMWMKAGALDYREAVGDDLKSAWGKTFTQMMKLKKGETVVFAYMLFKSRAHRDRVNTKVMKDMASIPMGEMPFDAKRMVYGGFKGIVGG